RFVGRVQEIADLREILAGSRLVTLTGTPGCGKSRLATRVAGEECPHYPGGVWGVDLGSLGAPELAQPVMGIALGLREYSNLPWLDLMAQSLRPRPSLLVIDNCHHHLPAVAQVAQHLLDGCPRLRLLVASREPLGLSFETVWAVPPLSLPDL